jgi:hypothetical protein
MYYIHANNIMSMDDLTKKLSERGIPQSNRIALIGHIVDHILDKEDSENKKNASNSNRVSGVSGNESYENIYPALSSIDQLSPGHPLIQRVQQGTDIMDPQLAIQYTQDAISVMKDHANQHPEKMRSIFRNLHLKRIGKDKEQDEDGSFLHDGYDTF